MSSRKSTPAIGAHLPKAVEVRFENVSKQYPDGTSAVNNLDLVCEEGKITVFVGPSGCGKTTSMRMINRMIEPTSGSITLAGQSVSFFDESALRRTMGYVIQNAGLFPHRTVIDNVCTVPRLLGVPRKEARSAAYALLERVHLDESLAKKYPYQLSGGQQQRVGVARALAADPPVLLMDEPFSAIDPLARASLQAELLRLQSDIEKTIVFVTHDIDEALRLADTIAVFKPGGVLAQVAASQDLLTHPAESFVSDFLGEQSGIKFTSLVSSSGLTPDNSALVPITDGVEIQPLSTWRLATDTTGRPAGWIPPGQSTVQERLGGTGRYFEPDRDNLRTVLDSIVLSPASEAIAVDSQGRALGLVSASAALTSLREHRGDSHD